MLYTKPASLRSAVSCLHNASMTNILIRDLPPEVHTALQRRAEGRGQSLQQYLTAELERLADTPTIDEVLARISTRSGGTVGFEDAVGDLAAERGVGQ
jgi:plasmid stability protein